MDELRPFGPPGRAAVVLPVAWRVLRAGSVIRGDDGALYRVVRSGRGRAGAWSLTLACGVWRAEIEGDADDGADVLVPGAVADAIALCREVLGARLIATCRDASGGDAPDLIWQGETAGSGVG